MRHIRYPLFVPGSIDRTAMSRFEPSVFATNL
jgi:hypothetical protein